MTLVHDFCYDYIRYKKDGKYYYKIIAVKITMKDDFIYLNRRTMVWGYSDKKELLYKLYNIFNAPCIHGISLKKRYTLAYAYSRFPGLLAVNQF
jgi:hypothetical protein